MTRMDRRTYLGLALTAVGALAANGSHAQEAARWPARPVRLIIVFAPGECWRSPSPQCWVSL
jgi:tripartite-type tricarboxylate transporter receptor subunit TctC